MSLNTNTATIHPTAFSAKPRHRAHRPGGLPATFLVLISFMGLIFLLTSVPGSPEIIFALAASLILAVCIIKWPITGTFMTVVMVTLFDYLPSDNTQTLLSTLGVFRNLSYSGLPEGLLVSLFELVIIVSLISALMHRFHARKKLMRGPLFWPMISFGAVILAGEVTGILSGGDFKISLWEIRPLLYLVLLYLLAVNTVSQPRHLRAILWLTMISIVIRSIEGIWRYTLIPTDLRSRVAVILEHDDSLFLVIPIGLLVAALLWRGWLPKHFFATLLLSMPLVLYMITINGRRAAYLCVMLIMATLLPMVWVSLKPGIQRQRLMMLVVVAALAASAYLLVFWNKQGGMAAPAQALRSMIDPSERDYNSNLYREQETENLQFTIARSPIMGIGFGKPMEVVIPMVDLTNIWSLQLFMPHNNMLWVWMRMGLIGFLTFWILIGASSLLIMKSLRIALTRWQALQTSEREYLASLPSSHSGSAMKLTHPGLVLFVVRKTSPGTPRRTNTHNSVTTKSLRRKNHLGMQECVDFLLLAFLAQIVLISVMAISLVDQGLMSVRLMPYLGLILGALAATWSAHGLNYRAALPAPTPPPTIVAHVSPEITHPPGSKGRILTAIG